MPFVLLSHADLKKFKYYYWMSTPALKPEIDLQLVTPTGPAIGTYGQEQVGEMS